jgi:zinc protease
MKPFQRWVLPNGLTFLYRHSPGVPLAAATLLIRAGSLDEAPHQAGLASLTVELMLQGTRRRSARRLAEDIESVGASMGSQTSEDSTALGFIAPMDELDRMLIVLAEVLTQPVFPPDEIKKERANVLAGLQSRQDSIFNFTYDAFNSALFGKHPYGRPIDGEKRTVEKFSRDDLRSWHQDHIQPQRSILALVGSLPPAAARSRVEKHLKGWKSPRDAKDRKLAFPERPAASQRVKLRSRFEQAYLMTGVQAPTALDGDHTALKVLNTLLGGGMSSRLFLRLREELGLAYEVSSFSPSHILTSQWVVYLGVPPEKLSLAKKELEKLLSTLQRDGPRPEEIRQAVSMIKGGYLMEHQTRRRQAWYAAWWEFLGKGQNQDQMFLKAIERVTPKQVRDLSRRLLAQPRVTVEVAPKNAH